MDLNNQDIIKLLKDNNIKLYSHFLKEQEDENKKNKEDINEDKDDGLINHLTKVDYTPLYIKSYPHYNYNYGFFTLEKDDTCVIILKGVYSDNIRNIKGSFNIHDLEYSEITRVLSECEILFNKYLEIELVLVNNDCYIKDIKEVKKVNKNQDLRDYKIPRPLSNNEYAEPKSLLYNEDVILSSGFFSGMFPNVVSNLTCSIFSDLQDILNPLFVSCNLKTDSPTIINLYGRIYVNMSLMENMFTIIGLNKSTYRLNFSQNLYLKMKTHKKTKLIHSFFPVTIEEIEDLYNMLYEKLSNIKDNNFANLYQDFLEDIVKFTIIYEYINIKLSEYHSTLLRFFPDTTSILQAVFKTIDPSKSFFNNEEKYIAEYFDFASDIKKISFNVEYKQEKIGKHISKNVSFFKRFSRLKIKKIIKNIHKLLELRNKTFLLTSLFIRATKNSIENNIKEKIDLKDVFHINISELRKIICENHSYGNINEIIHYSKWKTYRYNAQVVPDEIYGYDLSNTPYIAEDMINKLINEESRTIFPLNKGNFSGNIEKDLYLDNYKDKIVARKSISVTDLLKYKEAKGIILEDISPFSLVSEFAVLNNIPLYTGLRFPSIVYNNIEIKNNKIINIK